MKNRGSMLRAACLVLIASALAATVATATIAIDPGELGFELAGTDTPLQGWGGGPVATIARDTTVVLTGQASARIHRDAGAEGRFTSITRSFPASVAGGSIELRGFIRTEGVTEFAGFWIRQDNRDERVQFAHMQDRGVNGDTPWTEHTISSPLDPDARTIFVGALMAGQGTAWFDSLQILVDGRPLAEAPEREFELTVFDHDTEFDEGSSIEVSEISPAQAERVALLGRVWGFIKYHHPDVTAGRWHWDYELFRVLPTVLAADSDEAARRAILHWLERVGLPPSCDPCPEVRTTNLHLPPPVDWIEDHDLLGSELSRFLQAVYERRTPGHPQFYVELAVFVGNPSFSNESSQPRGSLPDPGFRMLAVLRYWNIIQYWFPYRDLIDGDWVAVLPEFLSRLIAAADLDAYRLEMMALIARVSDTHANLWQALDVRPPRGDAFWPVSLRMIEDHPTVVAVANDQDGPASGLQIGDAVLAIDGRPFAELVEEWAPYYCASNRSSRLRDMAHWLSRGPAGPGRVTVDRGGEVLTLEVERIPAASPIMAPHDRPGDAFQLLSPEVAYLKLSSVVSADAPSYVERAAGTRGLIVDIRNYPAEFVVFALGQLLVDRPTAFAAFTGSDLADPGAFWFRPGAMLQPRSPRYEGRVAVLVDESSISQAEYTAMALRSAPGAVVVGSTTAGADGNVSGIMLPGGLQTGISGIGVFYPDHSPTQRVGIVPDLEVRPTRAGIIAGRDEVLEAAIGHLLGPEADEEAIREMARRPDLMR
jgi:hypothetical protein